MGNNRAVLMTGATGFVGRHLVELLKDQGYDLTALVRDTSDTTYLESLNIKIQKADLKKKNSLISAFEGIDCVVHLATTMRGPWSEYKEATVEGTRNLLEVAREKNISKFIYLSSIAVYDVLRAGTHQISEETNLNRQDPTNYERSKVEAEAVVQEFIQKGMNAIILRPGVIYGPGGPKFPPRLGFSAGGNRYLVIGNGQNKIPFVYIHHLTEAIRLAVEDTQNAGEVFNIVDDQNISQNDYLKAYQSQVNSALRIYRIPFGVMTILGKCVGILKKPNPIRKAYLKLCTEPIQYSNVKAKEILGWKPITPADKALAETMNN